MLSEYRSRGFNPENRVTESLKDIAWSFLGILNGRRIIGKEYKRGVTDEHGRFFEGANINNIILMIDAHFQKKFKKSYKPPYPAGNLSSVRLVRRMFSPNQRKF